MSACVPHVYRHSQRSPHARIDQREEFGPSLTCKVAQWITPEIRLVQCARL